MKTKILFLLFLLGFGVSLFAQTSTKGYIIEIEGTSVIVDYTATDVKVGDRLQVFSEPKVMVHPVTSCRLQKLES